MRFAVFEDKPLTYIAPFLEGDFNNSSIEQLDFSFDGKSFYHVIGKECEFKNKNKFITLTELMGVRDEHKHSDSGGIIERIGSIETGVSGSKHSSLIRYHKKFGEGFILNLSGLDYDVVSLSGRDSHVDFCSFENSKPFLKAMTDYFKR
tara:strand:+ start:225 stop:671 length:447 start_codon:yes stop_codon:yes gene_type:complete